MKAVFVDCTPELNAVMNERHLLVPSDVHINFGDPTEAELRSLTEDADVLLVEHTIIPPAVLAHAKRLKGIVFMGTGAGTYVPLAEAEARGIQVVTTPGYGNCAVAEHAMALTFAAARKISVMDRAIRKGSWQSLGGIQLRGSKVAVVGLGEIGRTYADMARSLGMEVAGWNRSPVDEPYFVASLEDALHGADVVSLHLALNEQTQNIIDARRLSLLNPGAIVVNTARAGLIDEHALDDALRCGRISHAGVDVLWTEPLAEGSRWRESDSITMTAHAAYMTDEAYAELWKRTLLALDNLPV
ncbi:2-hydroxyacid dehydrogenase [Cupriavidus basilensis]